MKTIVVDDAEAPLVEALLTKLRAARPAPRIGRIPLRPGAGPGLPR